ncbi:MAG: hypothetical protein GY838_03255 [bacterium]|nr:hypothetical protein [bacterium]
MNHDRFTRLSLAVILAAFAATATPVLAQDQDDDECWTRCRDRKGWLVGFNAGVGGGGLSFDHQGRNISEEENNGAFGGLRVGYAFSNSFAVTLEMMGFGNGDDEDEEWGLGAGLISVTWWPDGSGFFVRTGIGGGGGEIFVHESGETVEAEDKGAVLFGIGYEWQLTKKFALGVAVDAVGFDLDGATGFDDDTAGFGGLSAQFNWYL